MRWLVLCLALIFPIAASAQDDGTVLSRFLEDQLSDGGDRQVSIQGFQGALSSEATLARLTIADADGVWLILEEARLNWNRAAVLRGEIQITELSAARLEVIRPPLPSGPSLSDAEATPFSLPNLPVSVDIGQMAIAEVVLGESIIGLPANFSIEGSAELSGGAGNAIIELNRLDGPRGTFDLAADYSNENRELSVSLVLDEAEGGLAVELLNIPNRPALRLAIEGDGPIDDFTANLALASNGEDRLAGTLTTTLTENGRTTRLDLGGDITPLLVADYHAFFGDDAQLTSQVRQPADGGLVLDDLTLRSAALRLDGALSLDANNLPEQIDVTATIVPPDDAPRVILPSGNTDTEIAAAALSVTYDRRDGDAYALVAELTELTTADLRIPQADLGIAGVIAMDGAQLEATTGSFEAILAGISHSDPSLSQAIGPEIELSAMLSWVNGAPVILSDLALIAGNVSATGGASAQSGDGTLDVTLSLEAQAQALDRFAALAGQPLEGSATLNIGGTLEALSGAFDLAIAGVGIDLRVAEAVPEIIFDGPTELSLTAIRNADGTFVRNLRLESAELSLSGDVELSSGDTGAQAAFRLENVGHFTDLMSGPVTVDADIARIGTEPFDIDVSLRGPSDIFAEVSGTFDAETGGLAVDVAASAVDLSLGNAVPQQLLAGRTEISAAIARDGETLTLRDLRLSNAELTLTGGAIVAPDQSEVTVDANLRNVGLFTDALSGAATTQAILTRGEGQAWDLRANLGGPGGMQADVSGQVARPDGSVDLSATGSAPLALANRFIAPRSVLGTMNFNVSMRGQPGLGSIAGTLSADGARLSAPTFAAALENIGLSAQISGGQLSFTGAGQVSTGGEVNVQGSVNLASAGLDGRVDVGVANARLVDPTLYEARVARADLTIAGPLVRAPQVTGEVILDESEIRVPEASLAGSAAIPNITFIGESRESRLTRGFAGLLGPRGGGGGGGSGFSLGMDITVRAPGRIFLRGRGIDAEFGGSIRLFGTTANMIPTGQFELIRGRLSVLGTRLDFVEGQATLQGSFDPFLRLAATSRASGYVITIRVDGPATSPAITFTSDPFLPEDEVLAQLLFGRSVSGLSPLQLVQLADAATSLAGGSTDSGLVAGLRDGLGLDDLDLSTDDEGNAAVTAGRYLSENIYTDVTINAEGEADLSLNIDLTPNITARGGVGSDGSSSIGIFFEQDY